MDILSQEVKKEELTEVKEYFDKVMTDLKLTLDREIKLCMDSINAKYRNSAKQITP